MLYLMGDPFTLVKRPTALRTLPPGDLELTSGVHETPKYSASSPFSPAVKLNAGLACLSAASSAGW